MDHVTSTLELDTRRRDVGQLELLHVSNTPTQHLQYKNMELKDKHWVLRLEKFSLNFSSSSLIFPILNHPCFFMVYYCFLMFFFLNKLSFSGLLQFKSSLVRGKKLQTTVRKNTVLLNAERTYTRVSRAHQYMEERHHYDFDKILPGGVV